MDEVVSFSLCSLCAIKLGLLYSEECHTSYKKCYMKKLLDHFSLPAKSLNPMEQFSLEDEFTFVNSIKRNPSVNPLKLVQELVIISISDGSYDARSHYLILEVALSFAIPRDLVEINCESIYHLLIKSSNSEQNNAANEDKIKSDNKKKIKKYLMIGLASVGGGAVIGVTGGLAAPIVASAFAGVIGAGSLVMSTAAVGVVGSIFGMAGAGLTASKMNKRIGDLEEFCFESLDLETEQTSLNITIAVSGWIYDDGAQQFTKPWKILRHTKEQYCIRYESKYLLELSQAMDYLLSFVFSYATQEALKFTFLASVVAAIAWPTALISMANLIDNPWDVCLRRSAQAGCHLATVLMSRKQGRRPVSLIGFSLGARVIFHCLQELAKQASGCEGLVGDVILLGAPVTASPEQWSALARIVSGRIVNGYSSTDWLLKFLYRTSSAEIRVAGLQEIKWKHCRLKNVNLTSIVTGHADYYKKLGEVLQQVGIHTVAETVSDDITDSGICTKSSINECLSDDSLLVKNELSEKKISISFFTKKSKQTLGTLSGRPRSQSFSNNTNRHNNNHVMSMSVFQSKTTGCLSRGRRGSI